MSKPKKPLLPWVGEVGTLVTGELESRFQRPFLFHQSGPYTQHKHPLVEIYFHEPSFKSIPKASTNDKYDERFGFAVRRMFLKDFNEWFLFAGFDLRVKMIARHALIHNIVRRQEFVANKLWMWIQSVKDDGLMLNFDQNDGDSYYYDPDHSVDEFKAAFSRYSDLERKSSGIHRDEIAGWSGASISVLQNLTQFEGKSQDAELLESARDIVFAAIDAFDRLAFLYDLLTPSNATESLDMRELSDLTFLRDERERTLANIVQRQGQAEFRSTLLRAYTSRCAISGCDVEEALDAAHIIPYSGPQSNRCSNGLLLRTDLHNLFDLNLLKIDPENLTVTLAPQLRQSSYRDLEGVPLALPNTPSERPDRDALKKRLEGLLVVDQEAH